MREMCGKVWVKTRGVFFYVPPREINPNHPRLSLSLKRAFKSYVNLKTTEPKLRCILDEFEVTTFARFIVENPSFFFDEGVSKRNPKPVSTGRSVSEAA